MNGGEIEDVIYNDIQTYKHFGGVWAADEVKTLIPSQRHKLFIINTDEKHKPGSHWTCFYFDGDTAEFFDPVAHTPNYYHKYFVHFLQRYSKTYLYNNSRIQNYNSELCGAYCIMFCMYRSRGMSMECFVKTFCKSNLLCNDQVVKDFMLKYI